MSTATPEDRPEEVGTENGGEAREPNLDELVVRVAERLMSTSAETVQAALDWTVETLARSLNVDVAFLRRNDHEAGVSILVAEYPRRVDIPDPDPLGVVPFDADPVFATSQNLKMPLVGGTGTTPAEYGERVNIATGVADFTGAGVPLVQGDVTTGILAFIHLDERTWDIAEVNALRAVASLLVQLNARVEAEERLRYIAHHDDLTGLPNRRAAIEEIDRRLERRQCKTALLFVDLDRFKIMNDHLGHRAGDQLLASLGERIRTSIRPSDFAARLGGDEFIVLMEVDNEEDARIAAGNLLEAVSGLIWLDGRHVSHTGSVGIAFGRSGELTADELLARADLALYAAKAQGGSRVVAFDQALRGRSNIEMVRSPYDVDDAANSE